MSIRRLLAVLILASIAIAGCGDDDDDRWSDNSYDRPGYDRPPRPDYDRPPNRPLGRWERFGAQELRDRSGRVNLRGDLRGDYYRELRITCIGCDTELRDVVIHFAGGRPYRAGRMEFDGSRRTHVVNLPGERRAISHVTFDYRKPDRDRRAIASVFAR